MLLAASLSYSHVQPIFNDLIFICRVEIFSLPNKLSGIRKDVCEG